MTDFAKLTDKELEAAINHHRRQRNISAGGVNQIANMHHTKMVKAGEAEMAKRISAKMESVKLDEAEVNYVIKHKKTRQVLNTHSDYATAKDEHEGLGADKHEYGVYKQTKKDAALRNRNTYREEAELEEASLLGPQGAIHKQASADQSDREYIKQMAFKNSWKAKNPGKKWPGYEKAGFNEEVEQIDEISKDALNSYLKKASKSVDSLSNQRDKVQKDMSKTYSSIAKRSSAENAAHNATTQSQHNKATATYRSATKSANKALGGHDDLVKQHTNLTKKINKRMDSMDRAYDKMHAEETELDEQGIKGWKHAASDIAKMRAAKGKNVKLVSLKKDGSESKMNDATKMFGSEAEAQEHHDRVAKLNPKMKIRHNLYVDGKHIKTLGEEVELEEASTKIEIPKSRYETILKMHGPKRVVRTPKGDMQYKGAEHFSSNKSTDTMITQTYSHPDHNIATIEKHTHNPTGKTTYYMYKKDVKEDAEQIDEISKDLKQRYVEKGAEDVYNRFTGRGKYEKPKDPSKYTKTGRVKKSALNSPESVKYREKLMNRRSIVNKVSNELTGKNRFEEFVLDEAIIQGSKEHLEKLKGMLDNAKPGSVDHSQIKHAIASMFGPSHIPEKHRGKS